MPHLDQGKPIRTGHRAWFAMLLLAAVSLSGGGCSKSETTTRAVIEGASMAPAYHGESLVMTCQYCGFKWKCETEALTMTSIHCPNCCLINKYPQFQGEQPEAVDIVIGAEPKRWDVVAFERVRTKDESQWSGQPAGQTYAGIKRVIGLPGETVALRNGDVFVNGQRLQKPVEAVREVRVPVFSSNHAPDVFTAKEKDVRRWSSDSSCWHLDGELENEEPGSVAVFVSAADEPAESSLVFLNRRGFQAPVSVADEESPVEDFYSYSPTAARGLHEVHDVVLIATMSIRNINQFEIRTGFGSGMQAAFLFDVAAGGVNVSVDAGETFAAGREFEVTADAVVEISTVDHLLRVQWNDILLGEFEIDADVAGQPAPRSPFQLTVRDAGDDGRLILQSFELWRDLYYFHREGAAGTEFQLGADEFFVLGDNVPVSIDSRHFDSPLGRSSLMGTVRRK